MERYGYKNVNPSYYVRDGGTDALLGMETSDGTPCFPAVSLTCTLSKIGDDCKSFIKYHPEHNKQAVIFVTLGTEKSGITDATIKTWTEEIEKEFGFRLIVHHEAWVSNKR